MALIPENHSPTAQAIIAKQRQKSNTRTRRLDPGIMAHPCKRFAWNVFRWVGDAWMEPERGLPFPVGKADEIEVLRCVREIVAEYHDNQNGLTIEAIDGGGHVGLNVLAIARGFPEAPAAWHIVMVEFYPSSLYEAVKRKSAQVADNATFLRSQFTMKRLQIDRTMLIGVGIESDHVFTERMHYQKSFADKLDADILDVVSAIEPPATLGSPVCAECKKCPYTVVCYGQVAPLPTCRTCCHSDIDSTADNTAPAWRCIRKRKVLTEDAQEAGCNDHLYIPLTIAGAVVEGYGDDWVKYRKPDGQVFENSNRQGGYKSAEIAKLSFALMGNATLNRLKEKLGGVIVNQTPEPVAASNAPPRPKDSRREWADTVNSFLNQMKG